MTKSWLQKLQVENKNLQTQEKVGFYYNVQSSYQHTAKENVESPLTNFFLSGI